MTTPRKNAKLKAVTESLVNRMLDEPDNYTWCIYNIRSGKEAEKVLALISQHCRETNVMFDCQTLQELAIYAPVYKQWRTVRIKFAEGCQHPNWHCYCSKTQ